MSATHDSAAPGSTAYELWLFALYMPFAGHRCREGDAKNTYGTGCFLLLHTGATPTPSAHGLLTTVACHNGGDKPTEYALEGREP